MCEAACRGPAGAAVLRCASPILPIRAHVNRIFRITVCLRPFRAAGPRLDVERVADKLIVHNYGHGGSGWSLSWRSADVVVRKAIEAANGINGKTIAVIGCGALGLTAATTAQRAGFRVTIYAKERPPFVRSSWATGSWTPDSRIALTSAASRTNGVALVEIKTPKTDLLADAYRVGAYPFSGELSGAIAQVLKYRHTFSTQFAQLPHPKTAKDLVLGGCPCVVIAGNAAAELDTPQ